MPGEAKPGQVPQVLVRIDNGDHGALYPVILSGLVWVVLEGGNVPCGQQSSVHNPRRGGEATQEPAPIRQIVHRILRRCHFFKPKCSFRKSMVLVGVPPSRRLPAATTSQGILRASSFSFSALPNRGW